MPQTPNASLASGKIMIGNASGVSRPLALSGDVTVDNAGAVTIAAAAVEASMVSLTDNTVLVGNGSNVAAAVTISGDVTTANTGAVTIGSEKVEPHMVDNSTKCVVVEDFVGKELNVADGIWAEKDTSSAGTPTMAIVADALDGQYAMTFDSQNEAQILTLYWNDELNIDIDKGPVLEFRIKAPTIPAATILVAGFAGAQNDTADTVAQNAWIRVENGTNILLESDDGTTDNDDKDSTVAWPNAVFREFKIDITSKSDISFYYRDTLGGSWTELTDGATTFAMAAYTGNLQPFIQWQKASGTGVEAVTLDYVKVYWTRS